MKYRIKSKIEKSLSYSKIHYLWFSIVLLFAPVHEFGHAAITILSGDKIINFGFWYVTHSGKSNLFQSLWGYSPLLMYGCVLAWFFVMLHKMDISFFDLVCMRFKDGKKTTV
jgi:hypothetical protein